MPETCDSEIRRTGARPGFPVRLGIIGGGQLARMTAAAALPLGVEVLVLEKNPHSPAARLSPDSIVGDWSDPAKLLDFAGRCDVITLENEFVDAGALALLEQAGHRLFPGAACIAVTQDKLAQKQALQAAGLAVPRFCAVTSSAEILSAANQFGWPLLLKTRRNGYDGKGNFTLRSEADIAAGWQALGGGKNDLLVEAFWHFNRELAVIVTRGRDGAMVVYPVVETVQRNHVCHVVKAPAQISPDLARRAAELARRAVTAVGGVGSFGVEMFLAADGALAVNELAPRVHNSGHYTIEACACSQFENHVRAVLGCPRGLENALQRTGARLHVYGKLMSGPGRKMGHVTVLENSVEAALAIAESAAKEISF